MKAREDEHFIGGMMSIFRLLKGFCNEACCINSTICMMLPSDIKAVMMEGSAIGVRFGMTEGADGMNLSTKKDIFDSKTCTKQKKGPTGRERGKQLADCRQDHARVEH